MELLDLQQKAEELVRQLNQLKDFSEKYQQNNIQAGETIVRASEVLSTSEQTLAQVNFLIEQTSALLKSETAKLDDIRGTLTQSVSEQGRSLQEKSTDLLQSLQTTFLAEQQKHMEEIGGKCKSVEELLETCNTTLLANLDRVNTEIREVQTGLKQDFHEQQADINKETELRLARVEEVLSERSGFITQAIQNLRTQTSEALQNTDSNFTSRMIRMEKTFQNLIDDARNNHQNHISDLDKRQQQYLIEYSTKEAISRETLAQLLQELKRENQWLHIVQLVICLILFLLLCYPYINKFL